MRLIMLSLAAMTVSAACVGLLFLYALIVPIQPPPKIAIVAAVPDVHWRGGPVEGPVVIAADQR